MSLFLFGASIRAREEMLRSHEMRCVFLNQGAVCLRMSSYDEQGRTLIEKANACARSIVLRWIRNVFREVSLQVLKRLWKISRNDKTVTLEVTHEHLEACERTCERLGTFWYQRLRDDGQVQVAEWVREVLERKRFWESDDAVLAEQFPCRSHVAPATRTQPVARRDQSVEASTTGASSPPQTSDCKLISTKLRRLGERNPDEQPPSLDLVIRTLDDMGRRGETAWPYDWSIIEEAARNNTKRLHSETIKGRPRTAATNPVYEVVPKSLVDREQHEAIVTTVGAEAEIDAVVSSRSKRLAKFLERKRKAPSEPSAEIQVTEALPSQLDPPRAPSHVGKGERWSWPDTVVASLSEQSRQELECSMIHPDEDNSTAEPHCVTGALKDVGRFHLHIQHLAHGGGDTAEEMSDKRQRRQLRKARKERMYPNVVDEREEKKTWTKVIRAVGENQEHWMELDMGECLMEIDTPDANNKILCAFSSLEITLKDEDVSNKDED